MHIQHPQRRAARDAFAELSGVLRAEGEGVESEKLQPARAGEKAPERTPEAGPAAGGAAVAVRGGIVEVEGGLRPQGARREEAECRHPVQQAPRLAAAAGEGGSDGCGQVRFRRNGHVEPQWTGEGGNAVRKPVRCDVQLDLGAAEERTGRADGQGVLELRMVDNSKVGVWDKSESAGEFR